HQKLIVPVVAFTGQPPPVRHPPQTPPDIDYSIPTPSPKRQRKALWIPLGSLAGAVCITILLNLLLADRNSPPGGAPRPAPAPGGAVPAPVNVLVNRLPRLTPEQRTALTQALRTLGRLQAATSTGVNSIEYGRLRIEAQAAADEAALALPQGPLVDKIR